MTFAQGRRYRKRVNSSIRFVVILKVKIHTDSKRQYLNNFKRNSVLLPSSVLETNTEDGPDQVFTSRSTLLHSGLPGQSRPRACLWPKIEYIGERVDPFIRLRGHLDGELAQGLQKAVFKHS